MGIIACCRSQVTVNFARIAYDRLSTVYRIGHVDTHLVEALGYLIGAGTLVGILCRSERVPMMVELQWYGQSIDQSFDEPFYHC